MTELRLRTNFQTLYLYFSFFSATLYIIHHLLDIYSDYLLSYSVLSDHLGADRPRNSQ